MAHCVSSRYVLSHYHRCKDPRCAVCGPVREAIQRNHEKQKQLAAQSAGGHPGMQPGMHPGMGQQQGKNAAV